MKFSILVIIKSSKHLVKLFNSINRLDYDKKNIEVLFLENNCDKKTSKIIKNLSKILKNSKVIRTKSNLNIPDARNYLLKFAKGKIIVFTDHDVELESQWLKKIEKYIDAGYDMVGGKMDSKQKNYLAKFENFRKSIWYKYVEKNNIPHIENANVAFKKKIFDKIKFDSKAPFAEDLDFTESVKKVGYKIKFDNNIYVFHNHRENLVPYLKTFFKYGVSHSYVNKKHNIVGLGKSIKILWYLLFPLVLFSLSSLIGYYSLLLFPTFWINKYTFPMIKNGIVKKDSSCFLVLVVEPLRFLFWSYGFCWGILK